MSPLEPRYGPAYKALARRLREAREAAGLTQAEVAARLGRPQSFVAKIEANERRIDFIELKVIARLYGQDLAFFDAPIDTGG